MSRMVFCKILEREITLARCKPVAGYRVCESCEGSTLKAEARKKAKDRKRK